MNIKKGIEYRPLVCYFDDDTKLMIGKLGLAGYGCLQLLFNKMAMENGYYLEWNPRKQALFTLDIYEKDEQLIEKCVQYCLDNGIFDKDMYETHHVLTSREIQKDYKQITQKRINPWHAPQYVYPELLDEPKTLADEYESAQTTATQTTTTQTTALTTANTAIPSQYAKNDRANNYANANCANNYVSNVNKTKVLSAQNQPTPANLNTTHPPANKNYSQYGGGNVNNARAEQVASEPNQLTPADLNTAYSSANENNIHNSSGNANNARAEQTISAQNYNSSAPENEKNENSAPKYENFAQNYSKQNNNLPLNAKTPIAPQNSEKIASKIQNDVHLAQTDVILGQTDVILGQTDVILKQREREEERKSQIKEKSEIKVIGEKEKNVSQTVAEPPPNETARLSLAQFLSQKLNKPLRNPNLIIDSNHINLDSLYRAVRESVFLQNSMNLDIDWLVAHYDDVVAGRYKDFSTYKKVNPVAIRHRNYDLSDVNFNNLDDFL